MDFHLGKPIAVMIALACVAGVLSRYVGVARDRADIVLWTFSDPHRKQYVGAELPPGVPSPVAQFEAATGLSVDVKLILGRAMNTRLSTQILGDIRGPEVPDATELEIGTVARFFNAPAADVGFLPLNDLLARHGWTGKIVENRLATWSKDGQVFGIPNDVHPTMIAYNDALFRAAGVDLASSRTWDEFADNCRAAQARWRERGAINRWAFELPQNGSTMLVTMLLQRGVNLIDADGQLHLTDPRVLDTLVRYCTWCVGPNRIGVQPSEGNQAYAQDLGGEAVAAMIAPDWRVTYIRQYAPGLAGKLRLMPLPLWPDSTCRTSTLGGTAVAIPRNARDPEASWQLIERLYLGPAAIANGSSYTLPAVRALWAADPRIDEADAYYSGQRVRRLIATLADEIPARHVSPASSAAEVALGQVLIDAIGRLRSGGAADAAFRAYCANQLVRAQDLVRRRIEHTEPTS